MSTQSAKTPRHGGRAGDSIPHSWDIGRWPVQVWPGESRRGRWLVRSYRNELMRHGALSRAGRTLVVIGRGYAAWLEEQAAKVPGYLSNNPAMRVRDARSDQSQT